MSKAIFTLDATVRTDLGKGASRRLRREDKLPGIIYGGEEAPVSITLEHNKVNNAADFEAFYSHVLTLNVDGKAVEVLVKDMQRHAFKPRILHVDFQRVIAGQELHTNVPLHFINEDKSAAIKAGGIAEHHVNEIEITCLPKDLPEFIEVDIANVEMDATLHLSDLTLPAGITSVELGKDDETHDLAVVTVKPAPKAADTEEGDEEAASEE
ncbi:50S ribosomal protein L25/general stress protein Ctc [Alteromonas sp. CI.11.F.A3]|uniref:50S ribosomal protein L25/general stress protein Ctc n=1 Tax=unclassified Alteromonas TaxID=2614992 RepID=UPI001B3A13DA|nr:MULTISPECIES: 50S ribosomal protein L25/general stress protein Ctc [unclassified Alteromonas]MBQ4828284.1 50S ribosomal protein L25/general stress protein Ctc [Alteromonas sp. MMG017]WOI36209.1 50S ribosomal protein L25/general stress protein Ctc [Alteromonas sp. CI.11.F.A3]|mmetsp:Transcript_6603/g.16998  ORF Transcript_6603/g.16998 Transcript_6603/m.16998 type:complete len:211 (-) Transcript_6603:205-837(-)|eukprot:CAMPEP_0182924402 /NCGR_PEP_ID=MMETSP0105_2-20130417/6024_1 /TAXON_ID=81532 ORGANISM="Acanthoeca-like sp., Strain 10tr" /NCGR_SAMPLE_ID=MMETSP0105_2 /ASSEMBLY_ACC=CAM_ASM_000205 /LENGTH=210 /DNA_ID=CAMNT_0025062173 /DNA_START=111 /DNA_END=743 /DNA_ORIENTATION=-